MNRFVTTRFAAVAAFVLCLVALPTQVSAQTYLCIDATGSVAEAAGVGATVLTVFGHTASDCTSGSNVVDLSGGDGAGFTLLSADGTANAGSDYTAISITPAVTGATALPYSITTDILQDVLNDNAETFTVTISAPTGTGTGTGVALGDNQSGGSGDTGTVTIDDDDVEVWFITTTASSAEAGAIGTITIYLDQAYTGDIQLSYGGTATATDDYTTQTVSLAGASGNVNITPIATIVNDAVAEADETIIITLAADPGYILGNPLVLTYTIENDDYDYGDLPASAFYDTITDAPTGAHHYPTGPLLGTLRDAEEDAVRMTTNADGDNAIGADEDGVSFSTIVAGGTASISVKLSGATSAVLNGWMDLGDGAGAVADGDFTQTLPAESDVRITDYPLVTGINIIPFDVPTNATGTGYARFRVTSTSGTAIDGFAADGEVEDYLVIVEATPTAITALAPVGGGTFSSTATHYVFKNLGGVTLLSVPTGSVASATITGTTGVNNFIVADDLATDFTLTVDGGSGGDDTLTIEPETNTAGYFDTITHDYDTASSGNVVVGKGATTYTIIYTGLEPIIDNGSAVARVFTFDDGNNVITLSADGDGTLANGISWIDCEGCGEATSFVNPTTSLTINADDGGGLAGVDTVYVGLLDEPLGTFTTLIVNGDDLGGAGLVDGADVFIVMPTEDYAITVNGGLPATGCPSDVLLIDPASTATVDNYGVAPGPDAIEFDGTFVDLAYTGIESVGLADLAITLSTNGIFATDVLASATNNALVVTVINNGPGSVACASVTLDPELAEFLIASGVPAASIGSFSDPVWTIGALPVGVQATLTIEGFVTTPIPLTASFTTGAPEDLTPAAAELDVSVGFQFPPKTQVNVATYVTRTITVGGTDYEYDQLIAGIFQGSPGIDGALWCKLPDEITDGVTPIWPPAPLVASAMPDLWRTCGEGLPFPMHPNDIFEDAGPDNDIATKDDNTLWLAVWGSAGLYRSSDMGQNWVEAWPGLGPGDPTIGAFWTNVYAITQDASGFLYISANDGYVFRSLNFGESWQQVGSLPYVDADTPWSMVGHPTEPGVVYAGTFGRGVFVSEDYGLSWAQLGGATENGVLVNNAALAVPDTDNPLNLKAGYIFDLEFAPDNDCAAGTPVSCFLFAATSKGVWRADVNTSAASPVDWKFMGPVIDRAVLPATCTLADYSDANCLIPDTRTLAFDESATPDALFVGTWGFEAFVDDDPSRAAIATLQFDDLALKVSHVTFLAISPNGELTLGGNDGSMVSVTLAGQATSTATEPDAPVVELPTNYSLGQNYPNPFNPVTTIAFEVPEAGQVSLKVYDLLGRTARTLVNGIVEPGIHEVTFDASNLPTGTYLYRLEAGAQSVTRMLTLLK